MEHLDPIDRRPVAGLVGLVRDAYEVAHRPVVLTLVAALTPAVLTVCEAIWGAPCTPIATPQRETSAAAA